MTARKPPRPKPPLTAGKLEELAIFYVGRFATSRSKLAQYLRRKLRERGWEGEREADVQGLVERLAGLGYVDDHAFALGKQRSLSGRGYGERRVGQALMAAGIDEEDALDAKQAAGEEALQSALRYAKRRRIGPYATGPLERPEREKAIAGMIRAGHPFAIARKIVDCAPGDCPDPEHMVNFP